VNQKHLAYSARCWS